MPIKQNRDQVNSDFGFYSRSLSGHRAAYISFINRVLGGHKVCTPKELFCRAPVLFLMIEDNFALYILVGVLRAAFGRRTVGLLFRPLPALTGRSLRLTTKHYLLRFTKLIPNLLTLSIVPTPLNREIGKLVDGWIHDFQLWDLSSVDRAHISSLRNHEVINDREADVFFHDAKEYAAGKPLLVAIGVQNHEKGIHRLATSMRAVESAGWAVMVAGRFTTDAASAKHAIIDQGGKVIDRHLSEGEILSAYASADAVWCLYEPEYDQASGILGRSVQLGIPAIVRKGSISEALCRSEALPHVAIDGKEDITIGLASLPQPQPQLAYAVSTRFASDNIAKLREALGFSAEVPK